ncbi:MAG: DUF3619 family protein [Betaproteobacteria bacterium]
MDEKQEKDFARGIVQSLNSGLSQIEEDKLARIRKSRQLAMAAYREPVTILGMVTVSGQTLDMSNLIRKPLFWLPIFAIAITIAGYSLTVRDDNFDETGELDAQLLTGELPIDAFLDKDFAKWVQESSQ